MKTKIPHFLSLIAALIVATGACAGTEIPDFAGPVTNQITATFALTSDQVVFIPVILWQSDTVTGVRFFQSTHGNYTADAGNAVALYSFAGTTLTRVAISADDGTLWKAASNSWTSKAFTSSYNATRGLWFIGILYRSSAQTTAPTIGAQPAALNAASGIFYGALNGQNALPSSVTLSSITAITAQPWAALDIK